MSQRSLALKQRLRAGEITVGAWLTFSNPNVAEIMAGTGFDWVLIDTEHGPFGLEGLQITLMAFNGTPTVPIVRVAWNDPVRIKQVLDLGADGVLVPMVNSAAEARLAVAACRYPPAGNRGFGPRRAAFYGRNVDTYTVEANEGIIVMIQIEHIDAVHHVDDILAVPGLDVICIGPTDLSGSAGLLRQFDHPVIQQALDVIVARTKALGLPVCMGVTFDAETMLKWAAKGATFVLAAEDTTLLSKGASDALERMRRGLLSLASAVA
jgi:2-keto-3-deoxy-L-rhamnonate aldolase RhmA